jgi:type VI protein secretion system component Hcp
MTITKELDKSSPKLAESVSSSGTSPDATATKGSGGGAGKVNVQDLSFSKVNIQDFHFTKRCGGKSTKLSCDGGECEISTAECPNGECTLICSWSWGMSQSGSSTAGSGSSGRCTTEFVLQIEDGVCTAMAINEKGLPGEKGTKAMTKK